MADDGGGGGAAQLILLVGIIILVSYWDTIPKIVVPLYTGGLAFIVTLAIPDDLSEGSCAASIIIAIITAIILLL